jgi:hypothetical protein
MHDTAQDAVFVPELVRGVKPGGGVGDDAHRHLGRDRAALAGLGDHGVE